MSVNAGGKPIVTDKLTHLWDPLSNVCYPSGSERLQNHFSEAHVKKITNGFGTNNGQGGTGATKNGLVAYGAETDHQRQKGYFVSDGSSDWWEFGGSSNTQIPIKGGTTGYNHPSSITFGGWFKVDSSNTSTRTLFGFGGTNSSNNMSYVYYSSSGTVTFWHEPNSNYATANMTTSIEDDKWHLIMATIQGYSTSACYIRVVVDGGLFGASSAGTSVSSANYQGSSSNFRNYAIGNFEKSSWQTSHLGDIGPHYIYAKVLSDVEMQQNYYALIDRFNF